MSTSASQTIDLSPAPDLHPLYATVPQVSQQIGRDSGFDPAQKAELIAHCLTRACIFGDIGVVQYLLSDSQAQSYIDLGLRDDDGVSLISLTIHGFGGDSDRDVEREECVRLLVSQGADLGPDNGGWTPLHYAALLSPPTLVSYLMTHGCSPFALTERKLTPLDIITARSLLPGREDVALLLEESMRSQGWAGGRMEERRRAFEQRKKKRDVNNQLRDTVSKVLNVGQDWWGKEPEFSDSDSDSEEEDSIDDSIYTPPLDYSSMLVFSPDLLPQIFDSLITNYPLTFKDPTPANTLYMLARFACLTCDHTWLEDLIIGATDSIEETFFNRGEDLPCLVFWLYNTTLWLHLMACDQSISEACEMLGSFDIIEEVINSVYVFLVRFAERRIDQLLDDSILSFTPLQSEFEAVQFESEWSFLRPFSKKKAPPPPISPARMGTSATPNSPYRSTSPTSTISSSNSRNFSSLRYTINKTRTQPSTPHLTSIFQDTPANSTPHELTSFLTALHTLLVMSDINPAITTQLWSQVIYWTSCEIFNRVITRKKYICRSRAVQIGMNLTVIEDWIQEMQIPIGIQLHLLPVKDLLSWLQHLSSITEFDHLIATIQTMKRINPLQMRRAVRDYKYEVSEGRMNEECVQYLTQLQKDWERHRVKLGVEAIRKEIADKDRSDYEGSVSSQMDASTSQAPSIISAENTIAQRNIDALFDNNFDKSTWEPTRPPQALGELLDSRHMLPLHFPSDPRLLAAQPAKKSRPKDLKRVSTQSVSSSSSDGHEEDEIPNTCLAWTSRNRKIRELGISILQRLDGVQASRWGKPVVHDFESDIEDEGEKSYLVDDNDDTLSAIDAQPHKAPLTRRPSARVKGRLSMGDTTPIDTTFGDDVR
ncbi:DIL domain-containing protein [Panaeolus papilionaceus]|nr:DIL domain-containing protein [Panaeolus papilionaceus]